MFYFFQGRFTFFLLLIPPYNHCMYFPHHSLALPFMPCLYQTYCSKCDLTIIGTSPRSRSPSTRVLKFEISGKCGRGSPVAPMMGVSPKLSLRSYDSSLYSALFDKVQEKEEEKAKCRPLTRFALMALARKNNYFYSARWLLIVYLERP